MPTLSVRPIRKPRRLRYCMDCNRLVDGPSVRLYGMADEGDKPWPVYLHADCARYYSGDERITAAVAHLDGVSPSTAAAPGGTDPSDR